MRLWEYSGKLVEITTIDNEIIKGKAYDYTSALDNEENEESITINGIELFKDEIRSIKYAKN